MTAWRPIDTDRQDCERYLVTLAHACIDIRETMDSIAARASDGSEEGIRKARERAMRAARQARKAKGKA